MVELPGKIRNLRSGEDCECHYGNCTDKATHSVTGEDGATSCLCKDHLEDFQDARKAAVIDVVKSWTNSTTDRRSEPRTAVDLPAQASIHEQIQLF